MISVYQGIGTSVPEKVKVGGAHDVSYQGGTFEWGVDTMEATVFLMSLGGIDREQ